MRDISALPEWTDLLDAAADEVPPMPGCVHIPFAELASRVHELPPRSTSVRVVRGSTQAVTFLHGIGRAAEAAEVEPETQGAGLLRLWKPNSWLEGIAPDLVPADAIDLACGSGREALYLSCLGWRVRAVDQLPDAIAKAVDLESRYGARAPHKVEWITTKLPSVDAESGPYDLVTSFFFLDRAIFRQAIRQLGPGGSFIHETFLHEHRQVFGKPSNASFAWGDGELPEFAKSEGLTIRRFEQGLSEDRITARIWATRV